MTINLLLDSALPFKDPCQVLLVAGEASQQGYSEMDALLSTLWMLQQEAARQVVPRTEKRIVPRRIIKTRTVPRKTLLSSLSHYDLDESEFDELLADMRLPTQETEEYSDYEDFEEEIVIHDKKERMVSPALAVMKTPAGTVKDRSFYRITGELELRQKNQEWYLGR